MLGEGNSRKPVFGFQLSKEGLFCKGLDQSFQPFDQPSVGFFRITGDTLGYRTIDFLFGLSNLSIGILRQLCQQLLPVLFQLGGGSGNVAFSDFQLLQKCQPLFRLLLRKGVKGLTDRLFLH